MADIITIGGATRDITFLTDKGRVVETPENPTEQRLLGFEYGAKIRSEDVRTNFGSGACNAAASLAKIGLDVAVCTRVGDDDEGRSILENMASRGVDTGLIQKDENKNTGFAFIVINEGGGGERVIFVHKGAATNLEIREEDIAGAGWVYLSALCGDWEEQLEKILEAVRDNGIKLVWNPGETEIAAGRKKLEKMLEATEIFIVNKDEAIELITGDSNTRIDAEKVDNPAELAKILKSWGPQTVVVTDGKNGACLCSGTEIFQVPAFIGKQIDTTGAGDAFGAGLLAGYVISGNFDTALKFGILNSAGTVSDYGAQNGILTREEIENSLDMVHVERIS